MIIYNDFIYYCDSYPAIGNGHLNRCIDITDFIVSSRPDISIAIMGQFSNSAEKFLDNMDRNNLPVLKPFITGISAKVTMLDTLVAPGDVDKIDIQKAKFLKSISTKLFVINIGYNTFVPSVVDAIINYVPITQYSGNNSFKRYFGLDFAPVTREFFNNDNKSDLGYDVMAIIGGCQEQYGPEIIAKSLSQFQDKKIGIIVSPHFPYNEYKLLALKYPIISFFQNVKSIKEYIHDSKAIICTYGNTTYESIAMGKPTFVVAYFEFQYKFAEYLEKDGIVRNLGELKKLNNITNDIFNERVLTELSNNCSQKIKSPGIENIGKLIIGDINDLSK